MMSDPDFDDRVRETLAPDCRIDRVIGQGGFGRVYAATDARLGRAVAVKVIRPDLAGATAFTDRFRREATALAKFRHPGIVPIFDIRERDGLIYYLMPLIEGDTLREKLEQHGRLAPKEAHRILLELCASLAHSHRAGIVHRDIKPDNIILEGFFGKVLLMDFGIAKAVEEIGLTSSGMMMGTPTYMSPEQISGTDQVDQRSDVYSVGALAYHMLTGTPPFAGQTANQLMAAHMSETPVHVRKLNPSVPRVFADAVMRCLEKNPDERFQSAMDLAAELHRVAFLAAEQPAPAGPPSAAPSAFLAGLAAAMLVLAVLDPAARLQLGLLEFASAGAVFAALALWLWPALRPRVRGETRLDRLRELMRGA